MKDVFQHIYHTNGWRGQESVSGQGSSLSATEALRVGLAAFIRRHGIRSLLDAPCGDAHWMTHLLRGTDLIYTGADIVPELIDRNRRLFRYGRWLTRDIARDPLPRADLLVCRDCLVHLPLEDAQNALANLRASGSRYLALTTFPGVRANTDIPAGQWRALNLQAAPFDLPPPLEIITERCTEPGYADKALAIWENRL